MKKAYLYVVAFIAAIFLLLFFFSNFLALFIEEIPKKADGLYSWYDILLWIKNYTINPVKLLLSFICALISVAVPLFIIGFIFFKKKKLTDNYGSSKWQTSKELKKRGCLSCGGAILGQTNEAQYRSKIDKKNDKPIWKLIKKGKLIFENSESHILVSCPTGRGKGINVVIPTLLSWAQSAVIYDIKKENYNTTSGWRRIFSHVIRFEPTAKISAKWNPLAEIRTGHGQEVQDAQNIAEILCDPDGTANPNDYWQITAKELITAVILHILFSSEEKSLRAVYKFLTNPDTTIAEKMKIMLETNHVGNKPHPSIESTAKTMLDKALNSEKEMSGVIGSALAKLTILNDPIVANNLSESNFTIDDIVNSKYPVSLYIVVMPGDANRLRPLTRLLLNFIGKKLTNVEMPKNSILKRHTLLFLIDEFPSLGKLSFFETQIAFFRGYKIKLMLITQSFNQLYSTYGKDTSIPANCDIKLVMGANDLNDAKIISDFLGTKTVQTESSSQSGEIENFGFKGHSKSKSETARNLLKTDEIVKLSYDKIIILYASKDPYLGKKIMYYLDNRFTDKVNLPTPDKQAEQQHELPPKKQDISNESIITPEMSKEPPTPISTRETVEDVSVFNDDDLQENTVETTEVEIIDYDDEDKEPVNLL